MYNWKLLSEALRGKPSTSLITRRQTVTTTKIEECKNYTCWLVARGFINNISSSTMCFSVAQTLINETAQYLASEPVSEPVSEPK